MGEIVNINPTEIQKKDHSEDLISVAEGLLLDVRTNMNEKQTLSVPIAELATLGAGVSSLIPALNTITQTTTVATEGVYTLANKAVGDTLKFSAKNGTFWGAFKTAEGGSKFAQLQEAGPLSATTSTTVPIDPATMMMAVALYSIEKQLGNIADMEKQILSLMEINNEAEIESDVETLLNLINKYKFNWDNEHFIASNHKLVLDIQRNARKHMILYQKQVTDELDSKKLIVAQANVKTSLKEMQKYFKYYRLALYTYSLSSMLEVMLSGNFKEEYISGIRDEIKSLSDTYRELFNKASIRLEKMSNSSVDTNVLKGIGTASKAVGKFVGSIPYVKEGKVDEFLQDSGDKIKSNALGIEQKAIREFASICNPGTGVFVDKMDDMIQIYNHTDQICFDSERIYLVAN